VRRIPQRYDSILCASTGYGKSLIFEALTLLGGKGKLVIVIGPLKALGRDQMTYSKPKSLVQIFQVIQRQEKGIDVIMINEVTTHTADIWKTSANDRRWSTFP